MSGEAVTVTQADREAYLSINMLPPEYKERVLAGEWDKTTTMQVLARHRSQTAPTAGDELVERQGQIELWFFRDLFDAHRDALLALCFGAGVADEAKNNQHAQRLLLRKLLAATRIQSDAATIADLTARLAEAEGRVGRVSFNVNETVWVKLTAAGLAHLRSEHDELNRAVGGLLRDWKPPQTDADGWCEMQLWTLMSDLGSAVVMGQPTPFETTIQFARAALKEASDAAE